MIFIFALLLLLYYIFLSILPGGQHFGVTMVGILGVVLLLIGLLDRQKKNTSIPEIVWKVFRLGTVLFYCWTLSLIVITGLLLINSKPTPIDNPDYLLILGAGLNGDKPSLTLQERLETGLENLIQHPELEVIVSGGQGPGETITEAQAMGNYLIENGIDKKRIIYESQSTSTMENFILTSELLQTKLGKEHPIKVNLVTSDFHILRAKILAKRNGFIAGGIPAPTPNYLLPSNILREYFALVKSLMFDYK